MSPADLTTADTNRHTSTRGADMIQQNPTDDAPAELTRTYTVAQLEALDLPYPSSTGAYIDEEYSSGHRWYEVQRVIFRDPADDTTWSLLRADPATEDQENDWWCRYASRDAIVCRRAVSREVTVTKWFDATAEDLAESGPAPRTVVFADEDDAVHLASGAGSECGAPGGGRASCLASVTCRDCLDAFHAPAAESGARA